MKVYLSLILLVVSALGNASIYVACDRCGLAQANETANALGKAAEAAKHNLPSDALVIFNPIANSAWHFDLVQNSLGVGCEDIGATDIATADNACRRAVTVVKGDLTQAEVDFTTLYRAAYLESRGTMRGNLALNASDGLVGMVATVTKDPRGPTAADLVGGVQQLSSLQRTVYSAVMKTDSTTALHALLKTFLQNPDLQVSSGKSVGLTVRITCADGSTVDVLVEQYKSSGKYIAARDNAGTEIMNWSNRSMFARFEHVFKTDQDAKNWLANARFQGITVTEGKPQSLKIKCSSGEGGVTCSRS